MPTSLRYGSAALDCTQQNLILACLSALITHFTPALQMRAQFLNHENSPDPLTIECPPIVRPIGEARKRNDPPRENTRAELTAVAEVADAVVDEHARLQDGRHGGRHGGGGGDSGGGRRGGARRVLVDDKVVGGGRGGGGGGRVASDAGDEGRREAGPDAADEGSGEHFFFFSPSLGRRGEGGGSTR